MQLRDIADRLKGSVSSQALSRVTKAGLSALPVEGYIADHGAYPKTNSYSLRHGHELVWRLTALVGARRRTFNVLDSHAGFLRYLRLRPEQFECRSCTRPLTEGEDLRFCDVCGQVIHDSDACSVSLTLTECASKGTAVTVCLRCFDWVFFADRCFVSVRLPLAIVKAINRENLESDPLRNYPIHSGNIKECLARFLDEKPGN